MRLLRVLFLLWLLHCSPSEAPPSASPLADGGATAMETGVGPVVDEGKLGEFCSNVGQKEGEIQAYGTVDECPARVCVADGRRKVTLGGAERIDTYCSAACEDNACPKRWECARNAIASREDPTWVCVKAKAICGNDVQEFDEACEDGNTENMDGCSADCRTVLPASVHVVSLRSTVRYQGKETTFEKSFFTDVLPYNHAQKGESATLDRVTDTSFAFQVAGWGAGRPPVTVGLTLPRKVGHVSDVLSAWDRGVQFEKLKLQADVEIVGEGLDRRSYVVRAHGAGDSNAGDAQVAIDLNAVVTVP